MAREIKILGTGCVKCERTFDIVEEIVSEMGLDAKMEKVEDIQEIMSYDVMATPAVVVDGEVVTKGGLPRKQDLRDFFAK